ncbi:MAG: hypothetical protein AB1416_14165, partial [Actinomycetota bacterium]
APGVWNLLIDLSTALGRIREPPHAGRVFGETLAGRAGWAALPLEACDGVARAGDAVQHEVPHFAAFTPAAEELARLRRLPLVTTLGARSGEGRREAARALAIHAGARVVPLEGCGHLAQVEAPEALAAAARGQWARRAA